MRAILAFLALTAVASAQQQAPVKTDCAVDGNTMNSTTSEPIPRAHVTLNGLNRQSTVIADNSGHWSFSNVPCGRVQIMATRPGFLNGGLGQPHIDGLPFSPVFLISGSPVHDVKIQLTPQSVIVGKVVDDQGDPINARVTTLTSRVIEGRRTFQQTGNANTNDLGEFRLANLTGGKYIVCARANERGPEENSIALGERCYPGPVEGGAASAMELPAGRETRVDFTLHEVPTVHVRGTISGMPKAQGPLGISLVKPAASPGGARPARINPDGRFDIAGVTPGSWTVSTDYFEGGVRLTARVPVEVGNADLDDVAVHLDSAFTVTGKVRIESKSSGAPANRQFALSLRSSEPMLGTGQIKWGADNASFTIPDVTPGNYRLDAFPPGPFYVKSATLNGVDLLRQEVSIAQSAGPIEIVLSDDSGAIDVQVTGADDQPLASSGVMFLQDGMGPRIAATAPDGHIKLQALAPGDYRIYAWDDAQQVEYADADWMQRYGGGGVSVSLQGGQTAQVTVKQQSVPTQ
jgi:hypothetical protein